MSLVETTVPIVGPKPSTTVGVASITRRPLHRLASARRSQGVSHRTISRKLKVDMATVRAQEGADTDILLSTLYQWQAVLDVPVEELLVEAQEPLSTPVLKRAQLLRLMKTTAAILERSQQPAIRRMAQTMVAQLIEIMPELREVAPWHAVGRRRTQDELGVAAFRCVSAEVVGEIEDD